MSRLEPYQMWKFIHRIIKEGVTGDMRRSAALQPEPLEQRMLFAAAAVVAGWGAGLLRSRGTTGADVIELSIAAASADGSTPANVVVTANGAAIGTFPAAGGARIMEIRGRAGGEGSRLGPPDLDPSGFPFAAVITGGDGSDQISGGDGN